MLCQKAEEAQEVALVCVTSVPGNPAQCGLVTEPVFQGLGQLRRDMRPSQASAAWTVRTRPQRRSKGPFPVVV